VKIVLDTNVFISGLLLPLSVPGRIVRAWRDERFVLVLCEIQWLEIVRVLHYPKINKVLAWDRQRIDEYGDLLRKHCMWVDISRVQVNVPNDPADEPILASLVASQSDYLVSGDRDLLALRERYPIITVSEFFNLL